MIQVESIRSAEKASQLVGSYWTENDRRELDTSNRRPGRRWTIHVKEEMGKDMSMQITGYPVKVQENPMSPTNTPVPHLGIPPIESISVESEKSARLPRVGFVSSFPPRECGIATFTKDLTEELDKLKIFRRSVVIAVNEQGAFYNYGSQVRFEIEQRQPETYRNAAGYVNSSGIALSNLQHEFGLFGGRWGEDVLRYLEELEKPNVVTFHTVLRNPKDDLLKVVSGLTEMSRRVIVMTRRSRKILLEQYGVPPRKLRVIPHGVPKVDIATNERAKEYLRFKHRLILSTFGLIHRGKGIEYVVNALPRVVEKEPSILYLVLGQTHPEVRKREGESYRNELIDLTEWLRMENHVRFHNRYLTKRELIRYIQATDIYIAPYLDEDQSSSGTLSYAMGFGKPVIATPFVHAVEAVGRDRGILCEFRDSKSIADAVTELLNPKKRNAIARRAYRYANSKDWGNVALRYAEVFKKCMGN